MRPAQLTPENVSVKDMLIAALDGFNEAGAINAGKRGEFDILVLSTANASMRPAQLTPENPPRIRYGSARSRSFNEAGAINAGKPEPSGSRTTERTRASMRPAQLTPENLELVFSVFQTPRMLQ